MMEQHILVRCWTKNGAQQEEYFMLDDEGRLDLSEVGLLFTGGVIHEADETGKSIGVLECDASEVTRKTFQAKAILNIVIQGELQHGQHFCGKCEANPIIGTRYLCTECVFDYSLCDPCFSEYEKQPHTTSSIHEHEASKFVGLEKLVYSNMWLGSGRSLIQTILNAFNNYGPLPCIGWEDETKPEKLTYKWLTYSETKSRFIDFSNGLRALNLPVDSKVGLYSTNEVEWILADLGLVYAGYTAVYMHYPMDDLALAFLINDAKLHAVVCKSSLKVLQINEKLAVHVLIQMGPITQQELELASAKKIKLISFADVEAMGKGIKQPPAVMPPTALGTIIYTSGSTGNPKGVMFTVGSLNASLKDAITAADIGKIVLLEYLPLSNTRAAYRFCFIYGGQYAVSSKGLQNAFQVAQLINPTRFRGVPLVWNKLFAEYQHAISVEIGHGKTELEAKEKVRKKFSRSLGWRIASVSTGSAPTSAAVLRFMKECFLEVTNAYGCTEVGSISTNQRVVTSTEYKLVDCEELGYRADDKPYPRGQVAVRNQEMTSGYYNNEAATKESFTEDGFFLTGDIAEERENHQLVLIDRKKNFFKLANGKFVRCEHLETIYSKSEYVHQIFISGDPMKDYVIAVVVLRRNKLPISSISETTGLVMQDLVKISVEHKIPYHEIPKATILETTEFSVEEGTLTPNFKKARAALQAKYKPKMDAIFHLNADNGVTVEILKELLNGTLGAQAGSNDTENYFANVDSISKVLLVSQIKQVFSKDIPINTTFQALSVSDLAKFVLSDRQRASLEMNPSFHQDVDWPLPSLTGLKPVTSFDIFGKSDTPRVIFMTGTTGFVGGFILAELLRRAPTAHFVCLVRASKASESPVLRNLRRYRIDVDDKMAERITEVEGVLGAERMGLSASEWDRLSLEVDAIVHCAASMNWELPYADHRGTNVIGTVSVLELAASKKMKPLLFVSTISVAGEYSDTSLPSLEVFMKSRTYKRKDGYAMSKWVSEHLVRSMSEKGLPVLVVRPGMVTGHSATGAAPEAQFVSRVLKGVTYMHSAPHVRSVLTDLTPVDFVAIACAHLMRSFLLDPSLGDTCFNLWNDVYVCYDDVAAACEEFGVKLNHLPYEEWLNKIRESDPRRNPLYAVLPFFPAEHNLAMIGPRNLQLKQIHKLCGGESVGPLEKSAAFMLTRMLYFLKNKV